MNIFITGATGYIGAKLALQLAKSGESIHILCRSKSKVSLLNHSKFKIFEGDILNTESIENAMQSCEYVYHLAAYGKVWSKDPQNYFDVNVQGTKNILDAAIKLGVKKVVVTSTAGVFEPSNGTPVNEESIRTVDFFNEYERSKYLAEEAIQHYINKGLDVVIVNPSRVYGQGLMSESNSVSKLIDRYLKGKWHLIPGNGDTIGNYAFIDDVVNGHILAMNKGLTGQKYILGGVNVSYNEFFDTLIKVSQKKYKLYKTPLSLMLAFARVQELLAVSFNRPPMITPKWVKRYLCNWALSSQKAERELGYEITPLEEGMEKTIKWLQPDSAERLNGTNGQ